jgi:superfamily II DNA or RNA helicase
MNSRITIGPAWSSLVSISDLVIDLVDDYLTYTNKGAQYQLYRYKKSCANFERYNPNRITPEYLQEKREEIAKLESLIHGRCCQREAGGLIMPTGLVEKAWRFLEKNKCQVEVSDARVDQFSRRKFNPPTKTLRKPQQAAMDVVESMLANSQGAMGMIVLPTGVGKTILAETIIARMGIRAVFLVPSISILKQTVKRFEKRFGVQNVTAFGGGKKKVGYITVATYHSVAKADPKLFEQVGLVVADEAHHCPAKTFFSAMAEVLGSAPYRFGLSATPDERADGTDIMIEAASGPVIYEYTIQEAIADGYLAKPSHIIYNVLQTSGQYESFRTVGKKRVSKGFKKSVPYKGDDGLLAYRNWVLGNDWLNIFVAELTQALVAAGKSVVILVDETAHGDILHNMIPDSAYSYGGNKDNEEYQREFNARKLKVLIGTSTIGEGTDLVPVDVLIMLNGGAGGTGTKQARGRALRNDEDSNGVARKPKALIIDFDYPLNPLLHKHSKLRRDIHEAIGPVEVRNMPVAD